MRPFHSCWVENLWTSSGGGAFLTVRMIDRRARVRLFLREQQRHPTTQPDPVLLRPAWSQPSSWLAPAVGVTSWPLDLHRPIYALSADKRFGSQSWLWNLLRPPWHHQLLSVSVSLTVSTRLLRPGSRTKQTRATPVMKTADLQLAARNGFYPSM